MIAPATKFDWCPDSRRARRRLALVLFATAPLLLGASKPRPPSRAVVQLVEKVIKAYGGKAALSRAKTFTERGHLSSPKRGYGTIVRTFDRPSRLRVEVTFPGDRTEVRELTSEGASVDGQPAPDNAAIAMRLQAARLQLPLLLLEKVSRIEDRGSTDPDGGGNRILTLPIEGKGELTVQIDPESGYIVRSSTTAPGGPQGKIEFSTQYDDYRKVDGVLFAFQEDSFAMQVQTATIIFDEIDLQPRLPGEPPGK